MTLGNTPVSGDEEIEDRGNDGGDDDDDDRTNSLALLISAMTVSDETTFDASVTIASMREVACFKIESLVDVTADAAPTRKPGVGDVASEFNAVIVLPVVVSVIVFSMFLVLLSLPFSFVVVIEGFNRGKIESILNT